MLRLIHFLKYYNGHPVLNIPDFNLEKGIYWLQGKNGSGKTTILRALAGLIPFEGSILLEDIQLSKNQKQYRSRIGFAEAEPVYPEFISGDELIRFYQEVRHADRKQTDMLTDIFKMHSFVSRRVGTYSSGMTKKLSLLLAFIGRPSLVLLDEPLANLDEGSMDIIPELIKAYYMEFGTSFIFSSHQNFAIPSVDIRKLLVSDQFLHYTG